MGAGTGIADRQQDGLVLLGLGASRRGLVEDGVRRLFPVSLSTRLMVL